MQTLFSGQHRFEVVDLRVALFPDGGRHQFMHARDQHVFVLGPVENSDGPFGRHGGMNPPQEIVIQFLSARLFEGCHGAALRIDAGHDVFDGAVFPRRVHSLQNDQQRALVFGVEQIVQRGELLHMSRKRLRSMVLRDSVGIVSGEFAQLEFGGAVDLQPGDIHSISF